MGIAKKRSEGRKIKDFNENDWKEILCASEESFAKGGIRGASIYTLTNFTATPAAVASGIVTASFGIAEQAHLLREGKLSELDFIENAELLCLDASVSALSSLIGQAVIPIPVLGAVIGNTVGTLMYQATKDNLSDREQELIKLYVEEQRELDHCLEEKYQQSVITLTKDFVLYMNLLNDAFSANVIQAFDGSVKLAKELGLPSEDILDSADKIEAYFC